MTAGGGDVTLTLIPAKERLLLLRTSIALFVVFAPLRANTVVLNFDSFVDSTVLAAQYAGVSFQGAMVLSSGITLNELEFPVRSGGNAVSDNAGPITIVFNSPVQSFAGYFTYGNAVTVQAFGTGGTAVGSATSHFSNNQAISGAPGSSPNELIQVSFAAGISKVTITGNPAGTSFVMDDATFVRPVSPCDVNQDSKTDVADVQRLVNGSLGIEAAIDVSGDGAANVVDIQVAINAVLNLGCSAG